MERPSIKAYFMYADSIKDVDKMDLAYYPSLLSNYTEQLEKYIDYLENINKKIDEKDS